MMECPACGARYADSFKFCGHDGSRLKPMTQADPLLGHVLADAYRLQRALGAGGYGVVYEAMHERLPIRVAVKVLSKQRTQDAVAVARFKREVEAEAVVQHPNVVKVIDYGHDPVAGYFIVMEHLHGVDLGSRLEEGKLPHILDSYAIIEQAGGGLAAAHKMGIVHRDVKADNVFLVGDKSQPQGFNVKLLDFGVAKLTRPIFADSESPSRVELHSTMASTMLGSPCTVSPEVLRGVSADPRADIYSFGAMLFEMLTGKILFAARNVEAMLERIVFERPTKPSRIQGAHWIPRSLDTLLLEMLEKDPNDRPDTIEEVVKRFHRIQSEVQNAWASHFLTSPSSLNRLMNLEFEDVPRIGDMTKDAVAEATNYYADMKPLNRRIERETELVLVIDDDRVIRGLVQQLVSSRGFDAEPIASAGEALDWMKNNPAPDAIVLDLLMPGMDGISFLKQLRTRGYQGPVIICSSVTSEILRAEAEGLSNVQMLSKAGQLHLIPEYLAQRLGA
ncbi:MAG: protein kinase [Myxococcales bacterium]|nr:protein kinase [Myxococcales bacterium]